MANDKRFLAKNGLQAPNISFSSSNSAFANTIVATFLETPSTISFSGSSGQLFSITDSMAGSIYAVNDISGFPSIEVFANGQIDLAPYGGKVVFGNTASLQANGSVGTAGQVLHSNGSAVYWAADDNSGTVTSIATANGLSGGTITTTGTLGVTTGSTLTVNTTGIHVNSALSISSLAVSGISTFSGNVVLGSVGVSANGGFGTAGQVLHSNGTATYWAADDNSGTVTSIATANGLTGGTITTTGTLGVASGSTLTVNTTGIHVNSALSITDLTLSGNLTVSGTRTYVNTTTLDVGDNIITLNADLGASAPSQNAGIEVMRGTSANVQFLWDETNDRWSTNGQPLAVSSLVAAGALSGVTTAAMGNTTITGFANVSTTLQVGTNTATFGTTAYIVANGNFGIGSVTPSAKLHVNGAAGALYVDFSGSNYYDAATHYFRNFAATATSYMTVGTSSTLISTNTTLPLTLGTNNAEQMRIAANGNIGFGTTAPLSRLDVREANRADSTNIPNLGVYTTTTQSAGVGGTLALGGLFDGSAYAPFGSIRGGKQNSTSGNYDGYLAFQTIVNGGTLTERMRIDSAGNIGVGVTPSAWGSTYDALEIRTGAIYDTAVGTGSGFTFNAYFNGTNWIYKGTGGNATAMRYEQIGGQHRWFTGASGTGGATVSFTQMMTLDASGNLGIGTGSPTTRLHLSQSNSGDYASVVLLSNAADAAADRTGIYGSAAPGNANPYRGGITFHPGSTGAVSIHTGNNTSPSAGERIRIDGSGNVGIGTASPGKLLDVVGQFRVSATAASGYALFEYGTSATATNNWHVGTEGDGTFRWYNGNFGAGTERMRMNSSGNLLLGTTTSYTRLTVSNGSTTRSGITISDTNTSSLMLFAGNSSPSVISTDAYDLVFRRGATVGTDNGTETVRISNANGNVAIGTATSSAKLHIKSSGSNIIIGELSSNANTLFKVYESAGDGYLEVLSGASSVVSKLSGYTGTASYFLSNVGIGTTSPIGKLSVSLGSATSSGAPGAWDNTYAVFGTTTSTGAAVGLGFNSSSGGIISSLAPNVAWQPMNYHASSHLFNNSGSEVMRINTSGNVGIGTASPGYKLEVNGSFAATTKSFVIDHPTKPGMKLRYGSLEGPENGVYVRGRLRAGEKIIQLPDYWEGLVDQDTYTVNLTPVGKYQELYVDHIASDYIIVGGGENIDCFYTVFAERNDVEKLVVEF